MLVRALNHAMSMCCLAAELWLNGGRMDAILVKASAYLSSKLHVSLRSFALELEGDLHVQRSNEFGIRELPDVQVVARHNVWKIVDVLLDVVHGKTSRYSLQQDARSCFAKWNSRAEDDDCNDERDEWIGVEAPAEVRQPDEES